MEHLDPHKQSTADQLSSSSERFPQPPPTVESLSRQPFPLNDESKPEQTRKNDSSSPELAINAATVRPSGSCNDYITYYFCYVAS